MESREEPCLRGNDGAGKIDLWVIEVEGCC